MGNDNPRFFHNRDPRAQHQHHQGRRRDDALAGRRILLGPWAAVPPQLDVEVQGDGGRGPAPAFPARVPQRLPPRWGPKTVSFL